MLTRKVLLQAVRELNDAEQFILSCVAGQLLGGRERCQEGGKVSGGKVRWKGGGKVERCQVPFSPQEVERCQGKVRERCQGKGSGTFFSIRQPSFACAALVEPYCTLRPGNGHNDEKASVGRVVG
jgi:hypothetical protein